MTTARLTTLAFLGAATLAGCGGAATTPAQPSAAAVQGAPAAKPAYNGNISWNKKSLRLRYETVGRAVLTYFGPDGYFTYPPYCKNGGNITATAGRTWGKSSGYLHTRYTFEATTKGADDCSFTAVLNNTGSPPIAIIELHVLK